MALIAHYEGDPLVLEIRANAVPLNASYLRFATSASISSMILFMRRATAS